jgi:hypothetical protein
MRQVVQIFISGLLAVLAERNATAGDSGDAGAVCKTCNRWILFPCDITLTVIILNSGLSNLPDQILRVRDIRTLPFFWVQRALLDVIRPSWRGLVAYNSLAYHATDSAVQISLRQLAQRVSVSEDTMRRGLAELVKKKAIQCRERYKGPKKASGQREQLPNEYILIDLGTPPSQPI